MDLNKDDKKCCSYDEEAGEGTSLLTRFLPMLDPAHAPVDPRSTQDVLVFAKHYAELVRYYDIDDPIDWVDFENGIITGSCNEMENKNFKDQSQQPKSSHDNLTVKKKCIITWKEFFYSDIAVVVASISKWQRALSLIKKEYNSIRKQTETNPTKENFRKLFLSIIHHLERIDHWYRRSVDQHPLKSELEVKIKSFLVPALKKLISYDKGMVLNVSDDLDLVTHYEIFKNAPWDVLFNAVAADDSIYVGNTLKQKIIYALMYVDDIFNSMFKVYEEVTGRSDYYWQQAIENFPTHQPHMALFISFVELFSYARNELNDLTRRQLEFFYRDVLHLKERPARADSVYLIYQLAKGVDEFDLKEGTQLSAGKDGLGKPMVYKTDKELVINKAAVKELKTIFLDKASPIKNIYAASVANSADGKGEKFKDLETAWSSFGYFEPRTVDDDIRGEKPEIGLAIASPLFKLAAGQRTIRIIFSFASDVPDATTISPSNFKIYFTGEKDWIEPLEKEASVKIVIIDTKKIQLEIIISSDQDPIVVPGKDFKNFNLKTKYPLCKIILNPEDQSYDRFKNLQIREIGIQSSVVGTTNIIMENDDGTLDPTKPAYLFTPFPKVGCALSIGSAELKDKQLISFSFRGEWIGKFDFENRYQRYDFAVTNLTAAPGYDRKNPENFKCSVELFSDKQWKLTDSSSAVNLFEVGNDKETLNTLDLNVSAVGSRPLAGQAVDSNNYKFARFTLTPLDFGHEIYPVLTAFQIANKLNKWGVEVGQANTPAAPAVAATEEKPKAKSKPKKEIEKGKGLGPIVGHVIGPIIIFPPPTDNQIFIPNPPYTPQAKSFFLDYTTGVTVLTSDNSQIFHIYPFGFAETYPYVFSEDLLKRIVPEVIETILPTVIRDKALRKDSMITPNSEIGGHAANANISLPTVFDRLLNQEKESGELIIPTSYFLPQFKFGTKPEVIAGIKNLNKRVVKSSYGLKRKDYFHVNQYISNTEQQGNLYIGISDLVPPQNLSLLFKFADGTAYDNDSTPPKINWSYLINNEWLQLPQDHIITDSTYGFQTTGIILFDFPADATNNNTILTTGLYWLCASIDSYADRVPKLIDVVAQASQAAFFDQQNDPAHYDNPLPEKTISKPVVKIPEVKSILQPFESFDGKHAELPKEFYQRVSERLRHKGRAITASDYEHLILEEFPSVYKVKVLSHSDPECLCRYQDDSIKKHKDDCCCPQVAPGHVLIIAISNLRNKNAIDPLKPRTGRRILLKIEEFLKKRVSPFVHVHAKNPKFEEIKVAFDVKFYTGIDKGFYLKKLNEDIVHYLTPWAYDSNVEVNFGNKIYASKIIDFIEGREYVDYITCFRMIHIAEGCCNDDSLSDLDCSDMHADLVHDPSKKNLAERFVNEISAQSAQAILVSAKQHCIELVDDEPEPDDCNCSSSKDKK